jgi:hypothetical protein
MIFTVHQPTYGRGYLRPVSFADRIRLYPWLGEKVSIVRARPGSAFSHPRHLKRALLSGVCALSLSITLSIVASPAVANAKLKYKPERNEAEHVNKPPFGNIPNGPLQIFVSIDQQKLYLYSDGTLVANTAVATGVPSLPTPMGVFSVIQKDRYHHSNIYSNAPMPYMQRITWSGVALHEGENIGHPASHGCIRMPHDFAARLWVLTKLGVRVIVARNELKPTAFADAHLFVHKDLPVTPAAAADAPVKTAQSLDNNQATDAGAAMAQPSTPDVGAFTAQPSTPTVTPKPTAATIRQINAGEDVTVNVAPAVNTAAASAQTPQSGTTATGDATAVASSPAPLAGSTQPAAPALTGINQLRGSEAAPTAIDANPEQSLPMPQPKPAALIEAEAATHAPITVFISRKTKKLYVRQNFTPLFDAPITIESPEQSLGTHVFTALEYLGDGTTFRWNVASLPSEPPRSAKVFDEDRRSERYAKGRRRAQPERESAQPQSPATPADALGRIEIPQDVIDQIDALMVPGSSVIVSDQGLGEETGEGTDFIVVTR